MSTSSVFQPWICFNSLPNSAVSPFFLGLSVLSVAVCFRAFGFRASSGVGSELRHIRHWAPTDAQKEGLPKPENSWDDLGFR